MCFVERCKCQYVKIIALCPLAQSPICDTQGRGGGFELSFLM